MKNNSLITALVAALGMGSVAILALAAGFEFNYRRLRTLQQQVVAAQNSRALVNALADDAVEYSKRNPAITPILQAIVVKPGQPAANSIPKPTSK